jgi:UDP-2-acetamido-2-deoxy-ribo-hexuluronate aminotransferase
MIKFLDLQSQRELIKEDINQAIQKVLDHGQFIQGPEVKQLEEMLAKYTGTKYCISVANGTDALLIAQLSLGIGPGDEVIMPGFNYISAAETTTVLGAKPVYVDVSRTSYNLNTNILENSITNKTKAIIATSLFGQCAHFNAINEIAAKYDIPVIEDAAQSFGASYYGNKSCNLTDIAITSFFPAKPLGCYGDGGAIFTSNDEYFEKISKISKHGQSFKYKHKYVGLNSRLDTLQAAILIQKLSVFDNEIKQKNKIAKMYKKMFEQKNLELAPYIYEHNISAYAQYTICTEKRDQIIEKLKEENIPSAIYYPLPVYHQEAYLDMSLSLNQSEFLSANVLSLPMGPYLTEDEISLVVDTISSVF